MATKYTNGIQEYEKKFFFVNSLHCFSVEENWDIPTFHLETFQPVANFQNYCSENQNPC